ncbi:hypothetical protein BS50DRAFT_570600 [Corynespora cassiicola Philippines]|uniref:Uncharacterized protein n=1 Tax=Corynespora cassiicola Philippines TaxID=1448308 RepID=A0A2T2P105_CORCC|nr:hypothetical protein BS50DRAFT_570600 [Corynespora cassiicola Philippines]
MDLFGKSRHLDGGSTSGSFHGSFYGTKNFEYSSSDFGSHQSIAEVRRAKRRVPAVPPPPPKSIEEEIQSRRVPPSVLVRPCDGYSSTSQALIGGSVAAKSAQETIPNHISKHQHKGILKTINYYYGTGYSPQDWKKDYEYSDRVFCKLCGIGYEGKDAIPTLMSHHDTDKDCYQQSHCAHCGSEDQNSLEEIEEHLFGCSDYQEARENDDIAVS